MILERTTWKVPFFFFHFSVFFFSSQNRWEEPTVCKKNLQFGPSCRVVYHVSHYYANYLSSENVTIMLMTSLLCSVTINIKRNKIQIKTDKKQKNKTDKKQCRVKSHHQQVQCLLYCSIRQALM